MAGEPEGELVESGTFLVDRARALQKLRDYQFSDPADFLLSWARCAVLSGAKEIRAKAVPEGLELQFNGRPLSAQRLEQPYAALFGDEEDGERYRHLAIGILAALRLGPERVTVVSGTGGLRVRLTVRTLEEPESLELGGPAGQDTEVRVEWPKSMVAALGRVVAPGRSPALRALAKLELRCGMLRVPLVVNGSPAAALPPADVPAIAFEEDGMRGVLVAAPLGSPKRLHFYKQGVRAASRAHDMALSLAAHIDDPGFRLDASHANIVEDERYGKARDSAFKHVGALIVRACEERQRRAQSRAPDLFTVNGLTGAGAPLHARLGLLLSSGTGASMREAIEGAEREAWVTAWLRRAAFGQLDSTRMLGEEAREALRETALYVSVTGKPLSLRDLERQRDKIGWVPYSAPGIHYPDCWLLGFEPSVQIVWLFDELDPLLRKRFGRELRPWQAYHTAWELAKLAARRAR